MALSLLFFGAIRYSIFDSFGPDYLITLSHFSKFEIIVGMSLYYVGRLFVSYRMNVRTSQKMLGVHR